MLQVTRSWLTAFAVTAMAVPTSIVLLVAATFNITLDRGEWTVVVIFAVLLFAFLALTLALRRFCSLPLRLQLGVSLASILLVVVGYWLVLLNVHSAA